ncbi:MAG: quinone-dependent dihydroorotate dehydrogenase [Gammaproteobacteria bacterium]|jgi:dihydroorotate dehydrogenase|nr:quinone-dependent dihydroorotate dehydrogenase [Gammaproteobacteria bacterium]
MLSNILKFFLYKIEPEKAHKLSLVLINKYFAKMPLSSNHLDKNLYQKIFNLSFDNPVGLAAGFDKNAEIYNQVDKFGFGFTEIGTITPKPQEGNLKPRVFRLIQDKAIINRLGFPNEGMNEITKKMKKNIPKGICGVNIGPNKENATSIDDYLLCFDQFFELASYIVINISSPNTPKLRSLHNNEKITELIDAIKKRRAEKKSNVPIILKVSPDIEEDKIEGICNILLEKSIDGVILTNTTIRNKSSLSSEHRIQDGGLSGEPLNEISNKIIQKFYLRLGSSIPIIGAGGVSSGATAYEKIKSGASLLQLYTALIYEGPYVAKKINKELSNLIKLNGYNNISEVIGINCK